MKRLINILFGLIILVASSYSLVFAKGIAARFNNGDALHYRVYFNAIPSGSLEWRYLGKEKIADKTVDILSVSSDAKIIAVIDITSDETIYLDSASLLPLKVERDLIVFGQKELITELYDQEHGQVKIIRQNSDKEQVINLDKPIRHVFSLLYFLPPEVKFEEGNEYSFTLPTQTLMLKVLKPRVLNFNNGCKRECYFLIGRGAKRFNLWLDQEKLIPLRIEFLMPLGKITLVKQDSDLAQESNAGDENNTN